MFATDSIPDDKFFSIGIHPWQTDSTNKEQTFATLQNSILHPRCVAIGEIGLDKLRGASIDIQTDILIRQIILAETAQKLCIMHCVKAYSELLHILKTKKPTIPIIIHDFNSSLQTMKQLLTQNCYFSCGVKLMNKQSTINKIFTHIPLNRIFLETDESNVSIDKIYAKAAQLKGIEVSELSTTIRQNVALLFKNLI